MYETLLQDIAWDPRVFSRAQGVPSISTHASMPIGARAPAQTCDLLFVKIKPARALPPDRSLALQSSHTRCEWHHRVGRLLPYLHPESPLRPAHESANRGKRSAKIG